MAELPDHAQVFVQDQVTRAGPVERGEAGRQRHHRHPGWQFVGDRQSVRTAAGPARDELLFRGLASTPPTGTG